MSDLSLPVDSAVRLFLQTDLFDTERIPEYFYRQDPTNGGFEGVAPGRLTNTWRTVRPQSNPKQPVDWLGSNPANGNNTL